MAESDASKSRIVNLVDLSDHINAKLSEEGGNICQAKGSLSVGPYYRKDIRPACISRTARAETNRRAERDSRAERDPRVERDPRAEPRVVDMDNLNDQNFWRSEKNKHNQRILNTRRPIACNVLYCYNVSVGA